MLALALAVWAGENPGHFRLKGHYALPTILTAAIPRRIDQRDWFERLADWATKNAAPREQQKVERQEQEAAVAAATRKQLADRVQQDQDDYLERRRVAFRGTSAQWEQVKGRVLDEYLLHGDPDSTVGLFNSIRRKF